MKNLVHKVIDFWKTTSYLYVFLSQWYIPTIESINNITFPWCTSCSFEQRKKLPVYENQCYIDIPLVLLFSHDLNGGCLLSLFSFQDGCLLSQLRLPHCVNVAISLSSGFWTSNFHLLNSMKNSIRSETWISSFY